MAGLPWIKVAVVLPGHPKLQMLEKFLGVEDGLGILVRLWCWTATYYPQGEFPASAVPVMEKIACGDLSITYGKIGMGIEAGGPPRNGDVLDALVSSGWLEPTGLEGGRYRIHDWSEFQAAHVDKAEEERSKVRERVRKFRNRKRNNAMALPEAVTETVTGNDVTALTEIEKETEKERETDSQPDGGLADLAAALGRQFGFASPLGLGKDPVRTKREFARWLLAVGAQETALECLRLASDKGEKPRHLSWFVGWLETVPDARLRRHA